MAKMNRPQLRGSEPVKNVKPSSALPTSKGQESAMENPRSYLKDIGDHVKDGHTKLGTLDPFDRERNPVQGIPTDT